MTYSITLPFSILKAAALFAGRKDIRYYLNCVAVDIVDPLRPIIIGTDGARMIAIDAVAHSGVNVEIEQTGDLPSMRQLLIPIDVVLKFKPSKSGRNTLPIKITFGDVQTIEGSDGVTRFASVTLGDVAGSTTCKTVEGVYPDWRRAIGPTGGVRMPADVRSFAPEYISACADAAALLGLSSEKFPGVPVTMGRWVSDADYASMTLQTLDGALDRVALTMPSTNGVRMVVMPRRLRSAGST
jgi:hypothetical protein